MTDYEPLGKYRLLAELGKGGFATVYRAEDSTLEREVALKVLDPLLLRDGAWVARFRREAKAVANLRHPHIVGIHEISEAEGRLYIAMELARGGSLAQAIATRGRIPWGETLALLQEVCEALDYAHGQGVIHRDLKPANILLDPEAGPLLTDFGFARLMSDNSMSTSLSGGILGTPAYIAPEVWELDQAGAPADIYALGCIVYEMLMGEVLFGGKTPMQSMRAHDKGPQYPTAWPEGVPGTLATVLNKALTREPEKRYTTAGILWHALSDLEAQAESARETAERASVAAQWRAEAEAAMAEGEWSAAKMAVGRWLAAAPGDKAATAMQAEIARRMAESAREATEHVAHSPTTAAREQRVEQPAVPATQPMPLAKTKASRRMPTWAWVLRGLVGLAVLAVLMLSIDGLMTLLSGGPLSPAVVEPTSSPRLTIPALATDYEILVAGESGVFIMEAYTGNIIVQLSDKPAASAEPMSNGHILIVDSMIRELSLEGQVLREMPLPRPFTTHALPWDDETVWVFSADDGTADTEKFVLQLDWAGNTIVSKSGLHYPFEVRRLNDDNLLIVDGTGTLTEMASSGDVERTIGMSDWAAAICPIPDGTILVGRWNGIALLDGNGNEMWFHEGQRGESVEWLPWGNALVAEWPQMADWGEDWGHISEMSPDGTKVWSITFNHPETVRLWRVR